MKVLNLKQNSEEWEEFRKGKSGGSELKDLWVAGMPLKNVILDKLVKTSREIPDKKHQTIPELAALLEPEELAELKLMGDVQICVRFVHQDDRSSLCKCHGNIGFLPHTAGKRV